MSQQLDASLLQQEEEIIQQKHDALLQFFKTKGYEPDSPFNDQLWFFQEINQDQQHPLWSVIEETMGQQNVFQDANAQPTIDLFVQKLLDKVKQVHLKLVDFDLNLAYVKEDLANSTKFLGLIEQNQNEYNQENAIVISYAEKNNQISEIQKFYKLKYKAGTIHQNYQALYAENSNRATCLSIDETVEFITVVIMGKRLDKNLGDEQTLGEDFKELAQITIPLLDIYHLARPRHFALATIPQCYLSVQYTDQTLDAPFQDQVQLTLRLDCRLGWLDRKRVIQQLKKRNEEIVTKSEEKMQKILEEMNNLISPFKSDPKLHYVKARGIGQPGDFKPRPVKQQDQDKDKNEIKPPKDRDTCCILF